MPDNLADYTDAEIASAVHFIDAHDTDLDEDEQRAWYAIRDQIVAVMKSNRAVEADNANG